MIKYPISSSKSEDQAEYFKIVMIKKTLQKYLEKCTNMHPIIMFTYNTMDLMNPI